MAKKTGETDGAPKEYQVLHPVSIDGELKERGAVLELTNERAAGPLKMRYIKLLS